MVFLFILLISILNAFFYGPFAGVTIFISTILLVSWCQWYLSTKVEITKTSTKNEDPSNKMANMKIPYRSEEIIGTYKDNPIYKFVLVQHPDKPNTYLKFDFEGTISFNSNGKFSRPPDEDEAYTKTELIYKNSHIEMTIQK